MKKKGLGLGALIGTILGIVVVLSLFYITYRLVYSQNEKACLNTQSWNELKGGLKKAEDGGEYSIIFRNDKKNKCYLVSFNLNDLNPTFPLQNPYAIIPDQQISQKNNPAICLCMIEPLENYFICNIKDIIKDCYFFKENLDFNVNGEQKQLSTYLVWGQRVGVDYYFLNFKKQGNSLIITYPLTK